MDIRWRALGTALLALVVTALPAAGGATMYGYGPHTDDVGLHWILDAPGPDPERPAVVCTYGGPGLELKKMLIRQPVLFADVSDGARTQRVGWRAVIQRANGPGGPWQTYGQTSVTKAPATGQFPADLLPKTFDFPANVEQYDLYRVLYKLFWYGSNGTTIVDQAWHRPLWYGTQGAGFGQQEQCYSTFAPALAGGEPYGEGVHSGKPGLHWILDSFGPYPEYPAVSCEYDESSKLARIAIRRPIVFARDTGPGVNRGDVAWKALLQTTLQNSGNESWVTVDETSSTRRSASDVAMADFLPKRFDFDVGIGIVAYRIVYRITWYKGTTSTVTGRADHFPLWYELDYDGGLFGWHQGLCYSDGSG